MDYFGKERTHMKISKRLLPLLVILAVFIIGCSSVSKTDIEKAITNELDLLKNLDSETTLKYISYQELFPNSTENADLSDEVKEVFSLFFQDFTYKVLDIDVDKSNQSATASVRLCTLDSKALAADYAASRLRNAILSDVDSKDTEENTDSLAERYLLLNHLLKTHKYDTAERNCEIKLQKSSDKHGTWEIKRTSTLENDLVGGLITYLSDPDILSPEDTLAVYLKTLKKMNVEEMSNFLGVESLLNTTDSDKNAIASALVEQVHKKFNYEITGSTSEGYSAVVEAKITSFDSESILTAYQQELDTYLSSTDAVIDGSEKRANYSLQLLLKNIQENKSTHTSTAVFHLVNDGISWYLENGSEELGNAIFGTLATTPVDEEAY